MMWIGIKADHYRFGEEFRQAIIRAPGLKDLIVDPGEEILLATSDGFGSAQYRALNAVGIELNQCAIAFLDFNDPVLDGHGEMYQGKSQNPNSKSQTNPKFQIPSGHARLDTRNSEGWIPA